MNNEHCDNIIRLSSNFLTTPSAQDTLLPAPPHVATWISISKTKQDYTILYYTTLHYTTLFYTRNKIRQHN